MARLSLYLDTRVTKTGPAPLKVRVHQGNVTKFIQTGIRIDPGVWDPASCSVSTGDSESMALATELIRIKGVLESLDLSGISRENGDRAYVEELSSMLSRRINTNAKSFCINPEEQKTPTPLFLSMMRKMRDSKEKPGTREVYERTVRAILVFDPLAEERSFEEIDYIWLKTFEEHCRKVGMKVNSISILMRNIRAVFNEAIRQDITENYPFKKYSIKQEETKKRSLSVDELCKLRTLPLESWQEEYRDMFFLSFYLVGINMVDLLNLRHSDLKGGRIEYRRAKTGTEYSIKVEPEAMAIIEKYRGSEYLLAPLERYRSAKDYTQHMDRALKAMGRTLGKQGRVISPGCFPDLSSYWARHSWATLAYSVCNVPVDVIAQALGHKDREHRVTMIYIRRDSSRVDEANRKVLDSLFRPAPPEIGAIPPAGFYTSGTSCFSWG